MSHTRPSLSRDILCVPCIYHLQSACTSAIDLPWTRYLCTASTSACDSYHSPCHASSTSCDFVRCVLTLQISCPVLWSQDKGNFCLQTHGDWRLVRGLAVKGLSSNKGSETSRSFLLACCPILLFATFPLFPPCYPPPSLSPLLCAYRYRSVFLV